jgi:hypothetical protein
MGCAVNERIERAASQVDTMMKELAEALYLNEAMSYITSSIPVAHLVPAAFLFFIFCFWELTLVAAHPTPWEAPWATVSSLVRNRVWQ